LTSSAKLVVDLKEQCATIGELHHALEAQLMTLENVHAELGEIIAGKKTGRHSDQEIIIFDSTGTALQDVAAAAIVYERALKNARGTRLDFGGQNKKNHAEIFGQNERAIAALSAFFPFR
jgi:ornithine cyclodeaminase/alanine dehydrogenase-like protein (mu-crystallin family)